MFAENHASRREDKHSIKSLVGYRATLLERIAASALESDSEGDVVRYGIAVTIEAENALPIYEEIQQRLRVRSMP